MASFLVVATDSQIINAIKTRTAGIVPQKNQDTDEIVSIDDTLFNADLLGVNLLIEKKYWNSVNQEIEDEFIRKLVLLTPGPYSTGTVELQFQQQDLNSQAVVETTTFTVTINGEDETVLVEDGTLEIELTCADPTTVTLSITAPRYETINMEVVVSG